MPVNIRYPIRDVLAECKRYSAKRRRKVFVEYVMLRGVNDRVEHALELAELLDRTTYKVNLIPYNPRELSTAPRRRRSRRSARRSSGRGSS